MAEPTNRLCMPFFSFLFFVILCLLTSNLADAHSYLTQPEPYTRASCAACKACPSIRRNPSKMHHTSNSPPVTWSRGQEVEIKWARNNHNAGFIRLSLVPLSLEFSESAAKHYALYYGCFEQGLFKCTQQNIRDCAVDRRGEAFRRNIVIPEIIPDGVYALSFLWYGGSHYRRMMGKFSDYTSCSYVRIYGGKPLASSYQPFFDTGPLGEYTHHGLCLTSAIRPGDCLHGCDNKRCIHSVPEPFLNGRIPGHLTPADYGATSRRGNSEKPESETNNEEPNSIMAPSPSTPPSNGDPGICVEELIPDTMEKKVVCCASGCGKCVQNGCLSRPGNFQNCCPWHIVKTERVCHKMGAPCFETDGKGRLFQ